MPEQICCPLRRIPGLRLRHKGRTQVECQSFATEEEAYAYHLYADEVYQEFRLVMLELSSLGMRHYEGLLYIPQAWISSRRMSGAQLNSENKKSHYVAEALRVGRSDLVELFIAGFETGADTRRRGPVFTS